MAFYIPLYVQESLTTQIAELYYSVWVIFVIFQVNVTADEYEETFRLCLHETCIRYVFLSLSLKSSAMVKGRIVFLYHEFANDRLNSAILSQPAWNFVGSTAVTPPPPPPPPFFPAIGK